MALFAFYLFLIVVSIIGVYQILKVERNRVEDFCTYHFVLFILLIVFLLLLHYSTKYLTIFFLKFSDAVPVALFSFLSIGLLYLYQEETVTEKTTKLYRLYFLIVLFSVELIVYKVITSAIATFFVSPLPRFSFVVIYFIVSLFFIRYILVATKSRKSTKFHAIVSVFVLIFYIATTFIAISELEFVIYEQQRLYESQVQKKEQMKDFLSQKDSSI